MRTLAQFLVPHSVIAEAMHVDKVTLYKHCRLELDQGAGLGKVQLAQSLQMQAIGRPAEYAPPPTGKGKPVLIREELKPNIAATIFGAKNHLGMRDRQDIAMTIQDFDPSALDDAELKEFQRLVAKANRRGSKP